MDGKVNDGLGINPKIIFVFLWIVTIGIALFIGFGLGKRRNTSDIVVTSTITPTPLLQSPTTIPNNEVATVQAVPTSTPDLESICEKSGPSQKKDFLTSYIIKENDTISSVAKEQLGSTTRDAEIVALNDNLSRLTVGSTLYLPPPSIKESSGKLFETSGKIVKKDNATWQLSYGGGASGPGIIIPGFWFKDIPDTDQYLVGDCVTILLDNGVKVITVKKSI